MSENDAKTCAHADCPLPPEAGSADCVLHSTREGKGRVELAAGFARLHEAGVIRVQRLSLRGADLSGISLHLKNLQYSDLTGATLHNARLEKVGFDFSVLDGVNFESAILEKVDLRRVEGLQRCRWYETIFDGVQVPSVERVGLATPYDRDQPASDSAKAQYVFRHFKELYKGAGDNEPAGRFYEREMDTKRVHGPMGERAWWWLLWATCGYGERPMRSAMMFFIIILGFALAFLQCEVQTPSGPLNDIWTAVYFSTVTFATVGYGEILPISGPARLLVMVEALLGVFNISLFVFVFCRRLER